MADHARGLVPKDKQNNSPSSSKGKNYLFAIAIDEYQFCSKLNNAVHDVQAFIDLMLKRFTFEAEHIIFIKNKEATKKRIETELLRLIKTITPQDNLVVYFSGHGRHDEHFGGNWVPVDAGTTEEDWVDYLSNDHVKSYLGRIKSKHIFLIADSCFSGSLFIDKSKEKMVGDRRDTEPSRWGLTSGKKEIVSDGRPGQHSPFAAALLDVYSKADQPPSVMGICELVLEKVMANAQQTPMGSPLAIPGHQGGQMVFYFKEDEDGVWQELKDTAEGCTTYLNRFPDGKYRALAQSVISVDQQQKAWDSALAANTKAALYRYEREYPDSEVVRSGGVDQALTALEEEELWDEAKNSDMVFAYRNYLRRSNLKKYEQQASEAIHKILKQEELQEWQRTKQDNSTAAYQKYLYEFPFGEFVEEAQKALASLLARKIHVELRDENNKALRMPFNISINNLKVDASSHVYEMHGKEQELWVKVEKPGYKTFSKKYAFHDKELIGDHLVIQLEKRKEASIKVIDAIHYGPISKVSVKFRHIGVNNWTLAKPTNENGETLLNGIYVDDDIVVQVECEGFELREQQFYAIENKLFLIEKKEVRIPDNSSFVSGKEASPKVYTNKNQHLGNNAKTNSINKLIHGLKNAKNALIGGIGAFFLIAFFYFLINRQEEDKGNQPKKPEDNVSLVKDTMPCSGEVNASNGFSETIIQIGSTGSQFTLEYDMKQLRDLMTIYSGKGTGGKVLFSEMLQSTDGSPRLINFDAQECGGYITIVIDPEGFEDDDSSWEYTISCPDILNKELEFKQEKDRQKYRLLATTMCSNSSNTARSYANIVDVNSMGYSQSEKNILKNKFLLIEKMLNLDHTLRRSSDQEAKITGKEEFKRIQDQFGRLSTEQKKWLQNAIHNH